MQITAAGLNRATLARQLLLGRQALDPVEATRRVAGLQAQEAASPYLALWNRVRGFDPAVLDRAFADGTLLKATLLRATLHAVPAADYPRYRAAMLPILRTMALRDRRWKDTALAGLDADELIPALLAFGAEARTGAEFDRFLVERTGIAGEPGLWRGLRLAAPLVHAATGPPWSFARRPSLRASPVDETSESPEDSLRVVAERYLAAFGPASAKDFSQFTMQRAPAARAAIASVPGVVEIAGPAGSACYDLPDSPRPDPSVPAPPRLLGMWDNVLLAHADRTRLVPDGYRKLIARSNGDTLPTLLVDGAVAGVWRPTEDGAAVEATAFTRLPKRVWDALAGEAADLTRLLADREPTVYRRYGRWWADLPAVEVRTIG